MPNESKLQRLVIGFGVGAALTFALVFYFFPIIGTTSWAIAFATLLALAVVSALLALTVSEGGALTAVDFLPHLAAVLLLGPSGAMLLVLVGQVLTDFFILRKDRYRGLFNLFQFVLATGAAALVFMGFGGHPSLESIEFRRAFPPFIVAALTYFVVNSTAVFYAVSRMEGRPFKEVWRDGAGTIIVFDVAMSSVAFLVAFLYVQWGAIGLLAAIIPMIGLRYSYGVNIELQRLNQDLLMVLIKTLEARDQYTSGHSIRVSKRSGRIAREMSLKARQVQMIETAALLHDIGKIDLAYGEILRQAGPLTPEQRGLIRAHPDKGVEIVGAVRSIDPKILACIRHHHEWFDGTGYPLEISGDNIPLGARIIMIADSIDAMLTDRPYRRALDVDAVRQELLRNSGSQFDPIVVDAALSAQVLEHAEIPESRLVDPVATTG
jgi:putative nucleotidyltransferase with HDIG domain